MKISKAGKVCVILLLTCTFFSSSFMLFIRAESTTWAGSWEFQYEQGGTEWYRISLNQTSDTVKGKAPSFFNSTIEATASGNKLDGKFKTDRNWAYNDIIFSLELTPNATSFEGFIWNEGTPTGDIDASKSWIRGSRTGGSGINLLIVPVNLQDQAITHSKAYYDDIANTVKAFFSEVSYGQLSLNTRVLQIDNKWVTLPKTTAQYSANYEDVFYDAVELIDDDVDLTTYDYSEAGGKGIVAFITQTSIWSDSAFMYAGAEPGGIFATDDETKIDVIYLFESRFQENSKNTRSLAHEFAHALGKILITSEGTAINGMWTLPDEYLMGNVDARFSLMGHFDKSIQRVHLDSFSKEWLGWLKYRNAELNVSYNVKQLDLMKYGDNVLRYEYSETWGSKRWYIFEVRSNSSSGWDSETTNEKALVLYYLDQRPLAYSGHLINMVKALSQPGNLTDPYVGVVIKLDSFSEQDAQIRIEKFNASSLMGAVVSPYGLSLSKAWIESGRMQDLGLSILPDVDLHAYTADGKHVGVDYQTGIYESQISGAISSGDLIGGTEWIFVPDKANVRFVTSSSDTARFYQEYPEAHNYGNGAETYALMMVYYSSSGNRYESHVMEQEISSGSTLEHDYSLTENADGTYAVILSDQSSIQQTPLPSYTPKDNLSEENQQTILSDDMLIIIGIALTAVIIVGVFLGLKSRKNRKNHPIRDQPFLPPPPPPPPE